MQQMRALFAEEAYCFTTWSGGVPVDDFIKVSIEGYKNGAQIMVIFVILWFCSTT